MNAARSVRPNETPKNALTIEPKYLRGSWLASLLEEGGFGNNVEVRAITTCVSAKSLDELVGSMMLASRMLFPGYSDEELARARGLLGGELRKMRTFEMVEDGGVRVGMKAWIGVGWKKGDEAEVPL